MRRLAAALLLAVLLNACAGSAPAADEGPPAAASAEAATYPEDRLTKAELEAHLRFLAADELMGRKTGTPGNDDAARYVAERFRAAGLQQAPGAEGYYQPIPFVRTAPPPSSRLGLLGATYRQNEGLLLIAGDAPVEVEAPVVFVGYGLQEDDYAGLDVNGKIVFTLVGRPDDGVRAAFRATPEKRSLAAARGAAAVVELYAGPFPWENLISVFGTPRFGLDERDEAVPDLPLAWLDDTGGTIRAALEATPDAPAMLVSAGMHRQDVTSNNVVGLIEGSDPALRDEYVVLMAHYDHIGAGLRNGPGATPADSIFNGARDNAMGIVALIGAAEALREKPPRRSILLLALTAEEGGLLGSRYYVDHPLLPLDRVVFAFNIDGGGFSDTTIATVIGLERTTAEALIARGAAAYGLDVIPDPDPEQNLFNRSDNANFARQGIPAPTFSPGFRSLADPGVSAYYHRPQDEADDDFDYGYLRRFVQAYVHAARLIADSPVRPAWTPGDEYEPIARRLYGSE